MAGGHLLGRAGPPVPPGPRGGVSGGQDGALGRRDLVAALRIRPVYPHPSILGIAQHRIREKETLARLGFPAPAFAALRSRSERLILERLVPFEKEVSVICARDGRSRTACYPVGENVHREGILDATIVPARIPETVAAAARELAEAVAAGLDLVGLLAVEMFLTAEGTLLINELAPRPHNSGHYTLDACACSQFEQLLRVACRLPLGGTDLLAPAAMVNLLGDVWIRSGGRPDFAAALAVPGVRLHLYDKEEARPRRKMGHLCATAGDAWEALARAQASRDRVLAGAARPFPEDAPAQGDPACPDGAPVR